MQCRKCTGRLEVHRSCRRIRLRCTGCGHEYHIHEVASDLDRETEELLERFTAIMYDSTSVLFSSTIESLTVTKWILSQACDREIEF